jgi:hypothetical protein
MNQTRAKLRAVVAKFSAQVKPVDFHISRTVQNKIQVVLVEHGEYEGYVEELANSILEMIKSGTSLLYRHVPSPSRTLLILSDMM